MLKRPGIAVLLVVFALAPVGLSACGGGDSETPAPSPTEPAATAVLTQAELISAGDGICAEVNAAVGSIQASDIADEATRATQVADLYAGLADSLEGLGTPSDGEPPTDVIAAARALGDVNTTDEAAISTFQTAATGYGMLTCAEAPVAPVDTGSSTGTDGTGVAPSDPGTSEPAPAPVPAPAPAPSPTPPSGGGVAPVPPDTGGGTGGSSGGSGGSSGGISPG